MCGFLGILGSGNLPPDQIDFYRKRSARLSTRGNTGKGEHITRDAALFHYRLAFRGLESGNQPMPDATKTRMLVYNGELYSFRELKSRLNYPFRTESDTEVLLAAWQERGERMLEELDGEFAFAIWDAHEERLVLGRDAVGIKPLFFASAGLTSSAPFREYSDKYSFRVR